MRTKRLLTSVASLSGIVALLVALTATPARAVPIEFTAILTGPGENPPNTSPGTGFADVFLDSVAHTLRVVVDFSGLLGTTTASHIHCCTATGAIAMVATTTPTFSGFPLGVTSGHYDNTLDLTMASSYNPAFVTMQGGGTIAGAESVLIAGLFAGTEYLNVHTNVFTGGEIRGFLTQVPEPGTLALLATALVGLGLFRRRRREL